MRVNNHSVGIITLAILVAITGLPPAVYSNTSVLHNNIASFIDPNAIQKLEALLEDLRNLVKMFESRDQPIHVYVSAFEEFRTALLLFEREKNKIDDTVWQQHQVSLEKIALYLVKELQQKNFRIEAYLLSEKVRSVIDDDEIKATMEEWTKILKTELSNLIHDLRAQLVPINSVADMLFAQIDNKSYRPLAARAGNFRQNFEILSNARFVLIENKEKITTFSLSDDNKRLVDKYGSIDKVLDHMVSSPTFDLDPSTEIGLANTNRVQNILRQLSETELIQVIENHLEHILDSYKKFAKTLKDIKKIKSSTNMTDDEIMLLDVLETSLPIFMLFLNSMFSPALEKKHIHVNIDQKNVNLEAFRPILNQGSN